MVFQDIRKSVLKNKTIDFNENTIKNFPFGKITAETADIVADQSITDAKISDTAQIQWNKISKASSSLGDIADISLSDLKEGQHLMWDGSRWMNTAETIRGWDPSLPEVLTNKTLAYPSNTLIGFPYITASNTDTLTNKTMDYNSNNFINFPPGGGFTLPDGTTTSRPKLGVYYGGASDGSLLLKGLTASGTFSTSYDASDLWSVYTSAASDASLGGISTGPNGALARRDNNSYFKIRFKANTSTERYWIGMTTDSTQDVNTDTHLNSKTGAGIMFSDVINNFTAQWNNGSASEQTFDTGVAKNTLVHVLSIQLDNANSKVIMIFDGTTIVNTTTQAPAATTALYIHANGEAIGTTSTPLAISYAYLLNDH